MKGKRIILLPVFVLAVIIIMIIIIGSVKGNIQENSISEKIDAPIYHADGSVTIPEGCTANGFYSLETNKIIDGGSIIKLSGDTLQGKIGFQQNFPEERNYLLIILIDYVQHDFEIEGENFQSYAFSLEGESEVKFNISVHLTESEGREFDYAVIPQPDEKNLVIDGTYNWSAMLSTREWNIGRFELEREYSDIREEQKNEQNYTEFRVEENISGFELIDSRDDLIVSVERKGGETVELVILNQALESEDENYVIMGFLNWKQVPIDGEHMKYYAGVSADTSISIPVILPDVEETSVFQILAFKISDAGIEKYTDTTQTSFRILVQP
ncbi:MAG: hypothetical protein NC321_12085 [Clostridium sp.]|nr:hypothetical protein [Clostridium sp.]